MNREPTTTVDQRYGEPAAGPTAWPDAEAALTTAELFWLTTVRPDGRPHCTPLLAVWHEGALHISTGPDEQKTINIATNPQVLLVTGRNELHGGTYLVVEGTAARVVDDNRLRDLARAWEDKYGPEWHYDVGDGSFIQRGKPGVLVFRVEPTTAYGFGKSPYSQTRWRF
jgi:general stress protein 26